MWDFGAEMDKYGPDHIRHFTIYLLAVYRSFTLDETYAKASSWPITPTMLQMLMMLPLVFRRYGIANWRNRINTDYQYPAEHNCSKHYWLNDIISKRHIKSSRTHKLKCTHYYCWKPKGECLRYKISFFGKNGICSTYSTFENITSRNLTMSILKDN